MRGPDRLSRWGLLNPRMIIVLAHAGFALGCFHRPNLNDLLRAYQPFGNIQTWGICLSVLAAVLLLAPRASPLMMLAQLVSAAVLFAIGGLLTIGAGILPTAITMGGLGLTSLLLFARAFGQWLDTQGWYHRWRGRPPAWLTRQRWFQRFQRRHRLRHG